MLVRYLTSVKILVIRIKRIDKYMLFSHVLTFVCVCVCSFECKQKCNACVDIYFIISRENTGLL